MERSKAEPPSPWESTDEERAEPVQDPVALLRDLLLGRAGRPNAAIGQREIRLSSAFVLGGVCLGLAGFGVIALAQMQLPAGEPQPLRELGAVLGGSGLLVLLWGILLGLPAHQSLRALGVGGVAIAAVGIAAFVGAYPQNWGRLGVTDHIVPVLATYVTGLVILVAATFASLVADFVLRMQVRGRLRGELGREPTDDEIRRDIDEAMRRHKVTWGGVVADTGKGIRVKAEDLPSDWQVVMPKVGRETIASGERAAQLDLAVDKLLDFRGGRQRRGELPESGVGDAADALRAMRTAKESAPKPGLLDRLLGRWRKPALPPGFEARARAPPEPAEFEELEGRSRP